MAKMISKLTNPVMFDAKLFLLSFFFNFSI